MRPLHYIAFGIVAATLLACSFILGRATAPHILSEMVVDTLTVVRIDTITVERPVYLTRRTVDTLYVPVQDTSRIHDTLFVTVPRTQAVYGDDTYMAWVSGYKPSLDSISIFMPVKTVEVTRIARDRPPNWGFGIMAGYGARLAEKGVTFSPFIGIGVTYNLLQW